MALLYSTSIEMHISHKPFVNNTCSTLKWQILLYTEHDFANNTYFFESTTLNNSKDAQEVNSW